MCAAESVEQAGAGHIGRWNSSIKVNSDVERLFCKACGHMQCPCVRRCEQSALPGSECSCMSSALDDLAMLHNSGITCPNGLV